MLEGLWNCSSATLRSIYLVSMEEFKNYDCFRRKRAEVVKKLTRLNKLFENNLPTQYDAVNDRNPNSTEEYISNSEDELISSRNV